MAIDLVRFDELKKKSAKAKSDADRAAGELDGQLKKLKADFGVDTIVEAEVLLEKLTKEEAEAEQKYNTELAAFEEKWKGKI